MASIFFFFFFLTYPRKGIKREIRTNDFRFIRRNLQSIELLLRDGGMIDLWGEYHCLYLIH
jgi:hypothetical protein